jgi:hypothetical protein
MIDKGPATADEMILAFVRAEIDSTTFGNRYEHELADLHWDRERLIANAVLNDSEQNRVRAELLKKVRGYDDSYLFLNFPRDVQWRRIQVDLGELAEFMYAKVDALTTISGGSRRVGDGARNIQSGMAIDDNFRERVKGTMRRIKNNESLPDLIAVQADDKQIILVDGHNRATAYVLMGVPDAIEVLIGSSPQMSGWHWF